MLGDLWPGLDLRHLAAFAAVAETRSFARAATALGYTQPAVSQQVASLEKIVGHRLFERSSGRSDVTLTEAGALLLSHVEAVTGRLAAARQDLADLACGEAGSLRVGAFQSALARILPQILLRYRSAWPGVQIESVESTDDGVLLDEVRDGSLDFAFALEPLDEDVFEWQELLRDELVLISKRGDRGLGAIESLEQLRGVPLIVYRTCRTAAALLRRLELVIGEVNVVFRSDDNAAIGEMVRAGVGAAILPTLWTQGSSHDGLQLAPLEGLIPPRVVVLAWRRGRTLTPVQRTFVEVAAAAYPVPRLERLAS
jgi:DNA-binding transcriptional LysR family regulator